MNALVSHLIDLGVSFVFLAALFMPLERVFTGRTQPHLRAEFGLDLCYFVAQYLVFIPLLVRFNHGVQASIGSVGPRWLIAWVNGLPLIGQAVLMVVLGDLLVYWGHRWSHENALLWRFHAVHHSVRQLDWLAAHREHPLDGLYSQLCLNAPGFFLGIDVAVMAPVFVFRGLCANFIHSNVRLPLGPFGVLFGDPALHRWHHVECAKTAHNFANLAPYLDILFRTHYRPDAEDYRLGLLGDPGSGFIRQLLGPLAPSRLQRRAGLAPAGYAAGAQHESD